MNFCLHVLYAFLNDRTDFDDIFCNEIKTRTGTEVHFTNSGMMSIYKP